MTYPTQDTFQPKIRHPRRVLKVLAVAVLGTALSAQAGKISSVVSATGAPGFGGWNLGNVQVVLSGTQSAIGGAGSWFDPQNGAYHFATDSDFSYQGLVKDRIGTVMGIVLAKDWPIGEPSGIKIVNDDPGAKVDKPANCIMSTSYLKDHYLDSADPRQVICSSPFQTHKRYKVAMLPTTLNGTGSKSVDLVFNVEAEAGERTYEVFQKINNWTDKRLQGFKVEIGFGVGDAFRSVTQAAVPLASLNIAVPSDLWGPTQLATFSAGLFGPKDKHTGEIGFFDPDTRAGFYIDQYVTGIQPLTDTLTATRPLPSNYASVPAGAGAEPGYQFGPWLPNNMLPKGIFWDDDGNPDTDAELVAWYGYNPATVGMGWMRGALDGFKPVSDAEFAAMAANLSYTSDLIDDLVNIGLNFVVRVGDVTTFPATANKTFTVRVTPTADTSMTPAPRFVAEPPPAPLKFASSVASILLQPEGTFTIGSLLTARVGDADLNRNAAAIETVNVAISASNGLSGTLTLLEQGPDRGVFAAVLPAEFSQVPAGTKVTLSYTDALPSPATIKTSSTIAENAPVPILSDASITALTVPKSLADGLSRTLMLSIANDKLAAAPATGEVLLTGTDGSAFRASFANLKAGGKLKFNFRWTAHLANPAVAETVEWVASITVNGQIVDGAEAVTLVEVKKGKNGG